MSGLPDLVVRQAHHEVLISFPVALMVSLSNHEGVPLYTTRIKNPARSSVT